MGFGKVVQAIVTEILSVLLGVVGILSFCALGLYAFPFSSSYYALGGLGLILFFSLMYGLGQIWRNPEDVRRVVAHIISTVSVSCYFFLSVPVTIERSVSVFLLQSMAEKPVRAHSAAEMESLLISGYICNSAVTKRMMEQQHLGNVEPLPGDEYKLTQRGQSIARWFTPVAEVFSVPHRQPQKPGEQCTKLLPGQ